jgi:hypothetical protein
MSAEIAKVVQSELRVSMLLGTPAGKFVVLSCLIPQPLTALDRVTSECLHTVHRKVHDVCGFGSDFQAKFTHVSFSQIQDQCSANEKQLAAARMDEKSGEKEKSRLSSGCSIHKAATVKTKCFELGDGDISGLIALALSERGAGRYESLRRIVGDICAELLEICRAAVFPTDSDAAIHREAVLKVAFPTTQPHAHSGSDFRAGSIAALRQRASYERCFNGDISDEKRIRLYVPAGAPNDATLKAMIRSEAPDAQLPKMLPVFPRHRWVGAQDCLRQGFLLAATYGILFKALPVWAKTLGADSPLSLALQPRAAAPCQPADDVGYESDDAVAQDGALAESSALVPLESLEPAAAKAHWPQFHRKVKGKAAKWALTDPAPNLAVLTIAGQPLDTLITSILTSAGEK